ncbi:hypothetical protein OsJ_34065 [Oryza sativa Japonica Group]|uniref:Uncharacterized protein n=1 Tax=Oryza sativa subsp. japonica TaxID=39947 RepID=A3CBS3_ORYSJ|nr:hypothetical protein OsJ_34065 [Oryza sativa Japonica Group]
MVVVYTRKRGRKRGVLLVAVLQGGLWREAGRRDGRSARGRTRHVGPYSIDNGCDKDDMVATEAEALFISTPLLPMPPLLEVVKTRMLFTAHCHRRPTPPPSLTRCRLGPQLKLKLERRFW